MPPQQYDALPGSAPTLDFLDAIRSFDPTCLDDALDWRAMTRYDGLKRALDLMLAGILIVMAAPVIVVCAVLISATSRAIASTIAGSP